MLGLTTLGAVHTAIGLIALLAGAWVLVRDKQIRWGNALGKFYVVTTFLTAATSLGIFNRGGFGPPHILSILTMLTLVLGVVAASSDMFGWAGRYVEVLSFSTTILFHLIPAFTESLLRLPLDAPLLATPDAPEFQMIYRALFGLYAVGLVLQIRWLRTIGRVKML